MGTPILGTNVASAVVPFTTDDDFPTHIAEYGKGSWQSAASTGARDAIPAARRTVGMIVSVTGDKAYQLGADLTTWTPFPAGLIPAGGTTGQALTKNSGTDYDTGWTGPYVQLAGDTMTGQLNGTNLTETGWGNFGSASTPTNTSNGDVTMSRLMVGSNVTFASVSTHGAYLSATLTDTAGGASAGTYVQPTISPAADSSTNFRGLSLSAQIDTAHNFSGSGTTAISAAWFEGRIINAGTIAEIHGASFNGLWLAGTAASLGTVTEVDGISIIPVESFGNSVAATVTTARGARILNSAKGSLTLTNQVGLSIDSLTNGTNNTEILLGTSTPQSGNWGIYQAAAVNNAFAGNTRIGSAGTPTASAALDVSSTTGALLIPRMTTTQRTALTAAAGMSVYDSTVGAPFDYFGSAWNQRPIAANPSATASDVAVNGTATSFMRSDAAPPVQKATTGQFGLVKPDGSTITISGGVISAELPTYVEGNWTPADNSGAALAFTAVDAEYTRIGRMVFCQATLTYPATADASNASISGLPYTVANRAAAACVSVVYHGGVSSLELALVQNTQTGAFKLATSGAAVTNATLSGMTLIFNFKYPVS